MPAGYPLSYLFRLSSAPYPSAPYLAAYLTPHLTPPLAPHLPASLARSLPRTAAGGGQRPHRHLEAAAIPRAVVRGLRPSFPNDGSVPDSFKWVPE